MSVNFSLQTDKVYMDIMGSWHLNVNPKFYDICFYFEFFPFPDSKHWQQKLYQQISGIAMTDPTLQWKKISPKPCVTFSFRDQWKSSMSKTFMSDFLHYWIEYLKKNLVDVFSKTADKRLKIQRDYHIIWFDNLHNTSANGSSWTTSP